MGMVTNLAVILFCISFVLWLFGFKSAGYDFVSLMTSTGVQPIEYNETSGEALTMHGNLGGMTGSPSNWNSIIFGLMMAIGIGGAVGLFGIYGNQSMYFTIPAMLLASVISFFLIPMSFISSAGMPPAIQVFIGGIMNLILLMAFIGFIRGGSSAP